MTTNNTTVIAAIDAPEPNLATLKGAGGKMLRLMSADDIAATVAKAVEFLAAQPAPVNTKDAFAGYFVGIPATKLIADVGLDDVHMLVALRDNEFGLEKALESIGWYQICWACGLNRAKADLSEFEFRHEIEWKMDLEEAITLVLAGDKAFESTDEAFGEAYDAHRHRLAAAESIVYDYLLNLTTKWTARDVRLARIYIQRLAESHEQDYKPRDFIPHIEALTELNEALLRGLEAAAA
jgi:hypothetical protein